MPTLTDLASRAGIRGADLEWLHALISDWQLLADLSFADLVLWAPLAEVAAAGRYLAGGRQLDRPGPDATDDGADGPAR